MAKIATTKEISNFEGIINKKVLTNSARSDFLNCRRKFQYNYVMGLIPRTLQVPFLIGNLFHKELELFYSEKAWKIKEAEERIHKAIKKEIKESHSILDQPEIDKLWQQFAMLIGMLAAYKQLYQNKDKKSWKIHSTEKKFLIDIKDGWSYSGRLDMIVIKGKDLFIVEHKTTSRLDEGYVSRLPLDNQIIGYSWALFRTMKMPKGVIYNVAKKSQLRQGQKEKWQNFMRRISDDYVLSPDKYFYRESLLFSKKDLQTFQIELFKLIDEIVRCDDINFYYKNPTACTMYGKCAYMPLCADGINKTSLLSFSVRENVHQELED